MTRDEVIRLMAWMKGRVNGLALKTVNEIISIAMNYSFLGKEFTFDWNKDLDDAVNDLLIQFTDAVLEEVGDKVAELVDEEDREDVLAYIGRERDGLDPEERIDKHDSELKSLLEAYLAVKFAMNADREDIPADAAEFLAAPNDYEDMRDAFFDHDYKSRMIQQGGAHFGRGNAANPILGIALVAQMMIREAENYDAFLDFSRIEGLVGFRVRRGSGYECGTCDEICATIHPIEEFDILPAHPHCMCIMVPITKDSVGEFMASHMEEYFRIKRSPDYKDVAFNEKTGGVMATHKNHTELRNRKDYEVNVQKAGFKKGHIVILGEEIHNIPNHRNADGTWDGLLFESAAAETGTATNIRNALKHCASKHIADVATIYFLNKPSNAEIRNGLKKFFGLKGTSQWHDFKEIIFVYGTDIYKEIHRQ